jgi:isoleucyl-tRNA synthetase
MPVMKEIGPVFGKESSRVKALLEQTDGDWLKKTLEQEGQVVIGEKRYEITPVQVTFLETIPEHYFAAQMKDAVVYVDCGLTPELEAEGYAREIIRRLQDMRRQLDLRVEDFIAAEVTIPDERIYTLLEKRWVDLIGREVRAPNLHLHPSEEVALTRTWDLQNEWDIEGLTVRTAVSRLQQ